MYTDCSERLNNELLSLEERAEELDKERTSTISTLSIINDRNRKNNVARAYEVSRQMLVELVQYCFVFYPCLLHWNYISIPFSPKQSVCYTLTRVLPNKTTNLTGLGSIYAELSDNLFCVTFVLKDTNIRGPQKNKIFKYKNGYLKLRGARCF